MKSLHQTYLINASTEKVWDALTNPKTIDAWGGGPAHMDAKVGTKFTLWGGDIHGKNVEVKPMKLLKQEWISGDWKEPSIVTFKLEADGSKTKLILDHTNIPDEELNDISQGWTEYYCGPMKSLLEGN